MDRQSKCDGKRAGTTRSKSLPRADREQAQLLRHMPTRFFQFRAAARYPTMSQPLMDGAFVGMEGDAQLFEDRFEPGIDFLYGHGPLSALRCGLLAGIASVARKGG